MKDLSIDIETYSSINIGDAGLYKYAQSPDFEILLFAYSVDFGGIEIVDLKQGEKVPEEIIKALSDETVTKHAYNAPFEWYCINRFLCETPIGQWRDTMFHGLYCGYTAGLEATGNAIGLPEADKKLSVGKSLIRYFCIPCKPTKVNGGRTRNLPEHDLDKWNLFKEYCIQDVKTEMELYKRLKIYPIPEKEQKLWVEDILMNSKGINVDMDLVNGAMQIDYEIKANLMEESKTITGLENPNSQKQLLEWLNKEGIDVDNIRKDTISDLLEVDIPDNIRTVLLNRQELAKTSVKKYEAMKNAVSDEDGRVRGLLQIYGANRTGRWAGRLVQVQNLPRNYLTTLDIARKLIKNCDETGLRIIYGDASDTLSQLIRPAFIPSKGNKFIISDYSAIEARVIAWLAGEKWVQDVFASHGKIYEATASQMFDVPIEKISRGNPEYELRQKGKVATLALGYQGGVGALKAMRAIDMGIPEEELQDIVNLWRNANKNIVALWRNIEDAALSVMHTSKDQYLNGLTFRREADIIYGQDFLTIELPSGRKLFYPKPFLKENKFGRQAIHFYGVNQTTRKWEVDSTYGGKLTENIVQAIARDCLAHTILELAKNYPEDPVVMHIHDEVVLDARKEVTVKEICDLMGEPIPWADGLILTAEGFESEYYMKD